MSKKFFDPVLVIGAVLFVFGSAALALEVDISGKSYIQYQHGGGNGGFDISRIYINVNPKISDDLVFKYTTDIRRVARVGASAGNTSTSIDGDLIALIKYAYLEVKDASTYLPLQFLSGVKVFGGLHGLPWIGFEEKAWRYRYVDNSFLDKEGLLTSADIGVGVKGSTRGIDYAVSLVNGTGYHAPENDQHRDVEAMISSKPIPAVVLGLGTKFSQSATTRIRYMTLVNYAPEPARIGGVYTVGQTGAASYSGIAVFGGYKILPEYDIFARYTNYDPNTAVASNAITRYVAGVSRELAKGVQVAVDLQAVRNESGAGDSTMGMVNLLVEY